MRIMNNTLAMLVLGESKKNQKTLNKQLKKVAMGTKITGAGDGASEYSISEKMRVKLRALGQDAQNVQTGASLLHVAEGGIQQQVDLLKTVKEKVLAANNDTVTDVDRQTIQKEINQSYDQMQDIAMMTSYNDRRVLFGGSLYEQVSSWVIKDKAEPVKDSDTMNMIPDTYGALDNQTGPFDAFKEYGSTSSTMAELGLNASQNFTGATAGTPNTIVMSLGSYNSVSVLDNVGFSIGGYSYVLTTDTSRNYQSVNDEIDISGCSTMADVAAKIKGVVNNSMVTATVSGSDVTFTTTAKSAASNSTTVTGITRSAATTTSGGSSGRAGSSATGLFSPTKYLSGGSNQIGSAGSPDPDVKYVPGKAASLSSDISSVPSGSGVTLSGGYYGTVYVQFIDGNSGLSKGSDGVYTLGKNASIGNASLGNNMYLSLSNGVMTLTSEPSIGGYANGFSLSDGIAAVAPTSPTTTNYTAVTAFGGIVDNKKTGTDGDKATCSIDLSGYNTSDSAVLETLIKDMAGKAISYDGYTYEFIDSSKSPALASINKLGSVTQTIDLNALRSSVTVSTTIATALGNLLDAQLTNSDVVKDAGGAVTGVKLSASGTGKTLTVLTGQLRSYDLDYGSWFTANNPSPVASALNGKGFRAYCATDNSQWFNFLFSNGNETDADKPKSGTATQDIKTLLIDVSKVTDAASLVKAIYDQAEPILTGTDRTYNHHMRLAADTETGVLTLYDERKYDVNIPGVYDYQEKGAKIADGVLDNVVRDVRNVYASDLIIQHTDKANMNIHIKIPRTTLDHVFGYQPNEHVPSDYNVMTAAMRERLLGREPAKGILDNGIEYLLSAITLAGAQTSHLEDAHDNIVTQTENLTAVESTIRDADMAKEMTEYTKVNVLTQSAQSMLAMANQNSSNVLKLLQ